jgi:glycosyltransferase involved in cell wall biosynthesis
MVAEPLVSIIIPTYNRAHLIGETLDSVIAQSYPNWECIVVDDGSTDYTAELLNFYCEKDQRIQFHLLPTNRNQGANSCRNYGFELSNGEYINWFDSDDIMFPKKIELQLRLLTKSSNGFCVCQMLNWNPSDNTTKLRFNSLISSESFYDFITAKIGFLTQAPLWKTVFLKNNNYRFDEELKAGQEWELFARILFDYSTYECINTPLVLLRIHNQNISNQKHSIILANYWLARYKVYQYCKLKLTEKEHSYFVNYMLWEYKKNLRFFYFKNAFRIFYKFILLSIEIPFLTKVRFGLAFLSYLLCRKGNMLLRNTKS